MSAAKYAALAALPEPQRLKALSGAIKLDLSMVNMALDIQGGKAANDPRVLDTHGKAGGQVISLDAVKAHLATKYQTPGDNPNLVATAERVQSWFRTGLQDVDLGWTNLFHHHDMRSAITDYFEILDATTTMKFKQRAYGEKTPINRAFGDTSAVVKLATYSAGLGVLDDWLRFQQYWNIEACIDEFRGKYWQLQAEIHYGLFTALGPGINQAYATDATVTFNAAAASILRAVKDKGYAVGQNAGFYILANPEKLGYVTKMLDTTRGTQLLAYRQNAEPVGYNVLGVIATTEIPANANAYYLVLPRRKIQRATWMDLTVEEERDIYTRAKDMVGTGQFNAGIGDTDQVRRVAFA